jgi:hypothetical protein
LTNITIITIITDDAPTYPEYGELYRTIWKKFEEVCNQPQSVWIKTRELRDGEEPRVAE